MRLIDRISLNRVITLLLGFILSLVKILTGKNTEDSEPRTPIRKRRRKGNDNE